MNNILEGGKEEKESIEAREYQVQLLSVALNENIILYLPTGSGKTFVAVMLIQCLSEDLKKPIDQGGKRTFFAVNTVALVKQQGDYIARHTPFNVGKYSGDLNVDSWDKEKWNVELASKQVIVLTAQILLDIIQYGFIKLEYINLIIFDECHHGVSDHCMRRIMMQFQNCPKNLHPRVLGLTGSLLNRNTSAKKVEEEIKKLESTFQGRVATVDNINQVKQFSTKPIESTIFFEDGSPSFDDVDLSSLKGRVSSEIEAAINIVHSVNPSIFSSEIEEVPSTTNIQLLNETPGAKEKKKLKAIVNEVKVMMEDLGLYGGSWAALSAIISLYRRKFAVDTIEAKAVISGLITHMLLIRKMITDELKKHTELESILKFSTFKVLKLLELLREYENAHATTTLIEKLDSKKKSQKSFGLIFVERRQTAKTLFHVLKGISQHDPTLKTLKPEFVVGIATNPTSPLSNLEKKRHHEAISKFRNGECNYLVASDVVEEGVDIPQCSLVIKFDLPKSFRSYVQSKGRARHSTSKYIVFVPTIKPNYNEKLDEFRRVEQILREKLIGKSDLRKSPSEDEVKNQLYQRHLPNYYSTDRSAVVDIVSAIPLVSRYCALLPHDKFTQLYPLWLLDNQVTVRTANHGMLQLKKMAYLQLPINSPLRSIVKGIPMENKRQAKRAVALITCVALHRIGELAENTLLPVSHDDELLDNTDLFPNWKKEGIEGGLPGTKKRKREYNREVPDCLTGCHPKAGKPAFLYHIYQTTNYEEPSPLDSRARGHYKVLNMKQGYAIITSKEIPQVCDFPIYISAGEIGVRIIKEENQKEIMLTSEEIRALEDFHYMLFFELLNICRQFIIVDKTTANSYLIAPTCLDASGAWVIDWKVVREFSCLPDVEIFDPEKKDELIVDDNTFLYEVVTPWYRGLQSERHYVVTQICEDMCAESPFPSTKYDSFEEYFKDKYNTDITRPELPLLEVKAISGNSDCIHPRGPALKLEETQFLSKRQMKLKQEDFNEHLIAELVSLRKFPSTLWLKAPMLPTVLHRLHYMLLAYELRAKIWREASIGTLEPSSGDYWRPLKVQVDSAEAEHCKTPIANGMAIGSYEIFESPEIDVRDLDREIEELCILDIVHHEMVDKKENDPKIIECKLWHTVEPAVMPRSVCNLLTDNSLLGSVETRGPELADVLSAITGASAGDVLNLERLETLGDSFLKFAVSTYLYLKFPGRDEGKLTSLKSKIISNRNLLYCAEKKGLGGKIKNCPFAPRSDWIPPCFVVPQFFKEKLAKHDGIPNSVLFKLRIPESECKSGQLSLETKREIVDLIKESKTNNTVSEVSSTLEALLGKQRIPDKTMADCVEALIGAWLVNGGIPSALTLLGWFGILPVGPNGPAKSWEELIGDERLRLARNGLIDDSSDSEMIGGLVDWDADYQHDTITNQRKNFQANSSLMGYVYGENCAVKEKPIDDCCDMLTNIRSDEENDEKSLLSSQNKRRKLANTDTGNEGTSEEMILAYIDQSKRKRKSAINKFISPVNASITADGWSAKDIDSMLTDAAGVEELLNYKFKNKHLLLQAFTHASYNPNRITDCYQRLEFLGDALLDFIITCHIYETCGKLSPGQLTDLRSALVNNITFASLVVRHGLHRHLLHLSPSLMDIIDKFVEFQVQRDHAITEECLILMEEDECFLAESVEVPKALGDILESVAGAIFLDSGYSLAAVWEVFYPIMKKEIDAFSKKVPKQPVRDLMESYEVTFLPPMLVSKPEENEGDNQQSADDDQTGNGEITASNEVNETSAEKVPNPDDVVQASQQSKTVMVPLEVYDTKMGKRRKFYGFGERKDLAKRAAAKIALRELRKSPLPKPYQPDNL